MTAHKRRGWQRCAMCERRRPYKGRAYCKPCALASQQLAYYWRTLGLSLRYDKRQQWSLWRRGVSVAPAARSPFADLVGRARWSQEYAS